MTKPLKVFISSTSEDLKRYRAAAAEVVRDAGWIADVMDHFPADPDPIVVMCQRRVSECDLFLLLQAFRRGGVPDVAQRGDGETSYTAFELRAADQLSKPVLVFLADEDKWPGKLWEDESAARAWVKDFRNKVNRHGKFFVPEEGDLRQFRVLIREAITHHKERLLDGSRPEAPESDARDQARRLAALRVVTRPDWPDTPYPLLQPYTHPDTFAGRDEELRKLDLLLRRPPLVLCLHAPSGAGKSSLLRAGLLPRLRAAGFPVSLERHPGEPGLARRLVADLLEIPASVSLGDDQSDLFAEFAAWIDRAGALAGKPPILILDQVDDFLRQPERRDEALARLGPLLAVTAQRVPGGHGFACRWVLCYRHEFHGEVEEWMHDVLSQARRAGRTGLRELPHDLSDSDRLHRWPVPLMGALQPGEAPGDVAAHAFLRAITRPLELRQDDGRPRYDVQFSGTGAERLAAAFAQARAKQPHAPLAPELQVVLHHLLGAAATGPSGEQIVDVPEDPAALEALIDDALARHLREALDKGFRGRDPKAARLGRSRALLALGELADDSGRRGEGLPRDELIDMIGTGGEGVLQKLESPDMRLVVEEEREGAIVCTLAHDRMAEVIARFVRESRAGALDVDRQVIELRRSVNLRSQLYDGRDDTSLSLTPEQHALIAANTPALVRSVEERQWWQQSDAWFAITERLRGDPQTGFRALVELTQQSDADWPRVMERLRAVGVSAKVFWEGAWGQRTSQQVEEVLHVVERTHPVFLAERELFRAMSYVVEEAWRREPALAARVRALRTTLREAFRHGISGADLPPLFRGDAWYLPDEPLLGFVEIPAGPFRMGSDKARDPHALDDEVWPAVPPPVGVAHAAGGQGTVDLPTFYIARYPVTVAQFRVFVEATGFRLGLDEALKHEPEHPFVVVSWHEALKYCEWLEERLRLSDDTPDVLRRRIADGWHVGLASEDQWEKAARGTDGNVYPWGDTIDPSRANYIDTGLGKTSLVGSFPAGASPYRGLDMSGNVWEWTLSLERPYPYEPTDGRENLTAEGNRVVRGGSFNNPGASVRAASRNGWDPSGHHLAVGFRVVVSRSRS